MKADNKKIWIRGQFVEVTDEVYAAYMKGDRKIRYTTYEYYCEVMDEKDKIIAFMNDTFVPERTGTEG